MFTKILAKSSNAIVNNKHNIGLKDLFKFLAVIVQKKLLTFFSNLLFHTKIH